MFSEDFLVKGLGVGTDNKRSGSSNMYILVVDLKY